MTTPHLATDLIKRRLQAAFGGAATYTVIGEPVSLSDAEELATSDPHEFQRWAVAKAGGGGDAPHKKGADRGMDGHLYFYDDNSSTTKHIIFSVKAGHAGVAHLRDLGHVVQREKAQIGVLLTMQEPTRPMRAEAAGAGFYDSPTYGRFDRLQILTAAQLLAGEGVKYPPQAQVNRTFKKAPRIKPTVGEMVPLPWVTGQVVDPVLTTT